MEPTITRRQLDALANVFFGLDYRTRREPALDRTAQPWGQAARYGRARSMGGASHRMAEAMGEAGLFPVEVTRHGRSWVRSATLTAKALQVLRDKWPTLPDIDARLAERVALEQREADEAAAAEAVAREQAAKDRAAANARLAIRMHELGDEFGLPIGDWPEARILEFTTRVGDALFARD